MTKILDIFDVRSTSDEAKEVLTVNECNYTIVEWQAIIGRLYAKAARFRKVTNKHVAWKKAASVRGKVNDVYREQRGNFSQ